MLHPQLLPPFRAPCLPALVRVIVTEPHQHIERTLASLPSDLLAIVDGLLHKDPAARETIESCLVRPVCKRVLPRYDAARLRRSLARETRLHTLLDAWSTVGRGGAPHHCGPGDAQATEGAHDEARQSNARGWRARWHRGARLVQGAAAVRSGCTAAMASATAVSVSHADATFEMASSSTS